MIKECRNKIVHPLPVLKLQSIFWLKLINHKEIGFSHIIDIVCGLRTLCEISLSYTHVRSCTMSCHNAMSKQLVTDRTYKSISLNKVFLSLCEKKIYHELSLEINSS